MGGRGCPDLGTDFLVGSEIGHYLQVEVMGPDSTHEADFGRITPHGGPQADREATLERTGRGMGLSPAGGCDGGGGISVGGYLRLLPSEHSCTV